MHHIERAIRLCLVLCLAVPALAQTGAGSLQGVVKDPTGAAIPGAQVKALRVATNQEYQAVANGVGAYALPSLQPGQYALEANAPGMQAWKGEFLLRTGQAAEVDVVLEVGGTSTQVTVAGDVSALISTVSSTMGITVERARIEQLPLNGRNISSMVQSTTPGVETTNSQLRTYGLRGGSMEFVQDGAVLSNRSWGTVQARPPGLDTVEEFKVETNNSSAKNNRPATAVMTTRSGTNQFHGALFETARNNGLGLARQRQDFYDKAPPLIRNEFGASGGGPVILPKLYDGRNKTFVFLAYEGYLLRQSATQSTTVWTQGMRNGDFSGLVDATGRRITIYDPLSTNTSTYQRTPFVGNQIAASRRSPVASHLFSITPLPTLPEVNPLVASNWFGTQPNRTNQHTGTMRFDHRLSEKNQFFVRYTQGMSSNLATNGNNGSPITLDQSTNIKTIEQQDRTIAVSFTRIFSPTFFSETLVNYGSEDRLQLAGTTDDWAAKLGLANPFGKMGFPEFNGTGVNMVFTENGNTVQDITGILNVDQNFTKTTGRHEFQFGARFRREKLDNYPQQQYVKGLYSFSSLATALYNPASGSAFNATPQTGHDSANLYLGMFGNYRFIRTRDWFRFSDKEYAGYLQDNWRIHPRLTLNLGIRIESWPILRERDNMITSFDPKSKSIVVGQPLNELYKMGVTSPELIQPYLALGAKFITPEQAGLPESTMSTDKLNYGPRVGFAYRVTNGSRPLVLRGGYARFGMTYELRAYAARARTNTPLLTNYNVNLNAADRSPDGKPNYLLRSVPSLVAGVNTQNLVDPKQPSAVTPGFGGTYFDPYQPASRADQWNLTMEREVLSNTVVRASFVGTHGSKLDQMHQYNEAKPNYAWYVDQKVPLPTGSLASVATRPWSTEPYGTLELLQKSGWSNFSGAQVEVERRYSRGIGFQFFYVMSNAARAGGNGWQDQFLQDPWVFLNGAVPEDEQARNRLLNYQRDTGIPKHRFRWNWIVDLPFGRGKLVGHSAGGILNRVIGGWQLAGFGNAVSRYVALPVTNWGSVGNLEIYGTKYPIEDCRSGRCIPGYLYFNGYIPANRINSHDANGKPNGVMGVPANYKPSNLPVWPTPAGGAVAGDPNSIYLESNTVFVPLNNGTLQQVAKDTGLHPWQNQSFLGPMLLNLDASLFKAVDVTERIKLRFNADFFNVLNMPGKQVPGANGILSLQNSANAPRQLQLTMRLSW